MSVRADREWLMNRNRPRLAKAAAKVLIGYDGDDMARVTTGYQDLSRVDLANLKWAMERAMDKAARQVLGGQLGIKCVVHVEIKIEDGEDPEFQPKQDEAPAGSAAEASD